MEIPYLIDTHAHIDMAENSDEIIQNATQNGVKKIIIPSVEEKFFEKIIQIAENHENIYCQLGIFPSEAKTWTNKIEQKIKELEKNPKVVAIGEIGLDYYWDKSFVDKQKEVFIKQIEIANRLKLPITVHDREAHNDTLEIIDKYNKSSQIVFHCFSGDVDFMKKVVERGYYIAIGGIVTFKKADTLKKVASEVPLDRLLLETDAPYLAPVPYRGKENQPAYIKYTAEEIAKLRGISLEEIAEVTTRNAEKVFNI